AYHRQAVAKLGLEAAHVEHYQRGEQAEDQEQRDAAMPAFLRPQALLISEMLFLEDFELPLADRLAARNEHQAARIFLQDGTIGVLGGLVDRPGRGLGVVAPRLEQIDELDLVDNFEIDAGP